MINMDYVVTEDFEEPENFEFKYVHPSEATRALSDADFEPLSGVTTPTGKIKFTKDMLCDRLCLLKDALDAELHLPVNKRMEDLTNVQRAEQLFELLCFIFSSIGSMVLMIEKVSIFYSILETNVTSSTQLTLQHLQQFH